MKPMLAWETIKEVFCCGRPIEEDVIMIGENSNTQPCNNNGSIIDPLTKKYSPQQNPSMP